MSLGWNKDARLHRPFPQGRATLRAYQTPGVRRRITLRVAVRVVAVSTCNGKSTGSRVRLAALTGALIAGTAQMLGGPPCASRQECTFSRGSPCGGKGDTQSTVGTQGADTPRHGDNEGGARRGREDSSQFKGQGMCTPEHRCPTHTSTQPWEHTGTPMKTHIGMRRRKHMCRTHINMYVTRCARVGTQKRHACSVQTIHMCKSMLAHVYNMQLTYVHAARACCSCPFKKLWPHPMQTISASSGDRRGHRGQSREVG